ncbi:MAG: hypothetical protein NT121_10760, partial [Chloroflexi bacterium]|nr:hypothetical protein [Chloroflexota bacterium]
MAERHKKSHRPGGQWQANQPAADGVTPLASRQARAADDDRGQDQFERQDIHWMTVIRVDFAPADFNADATASASAGLTS